MTRSSRRAARRCALPIGSLAALALGSLALACSSALDGDGSLPLTSIAECIELGGAPLFDPDDGRPVEQSCPEGLTFVAVFDEEFYGADSGICCTGPEGVEPDVAVEP